MPVSRFLLRLHRRRGEIIYLIGDDDVTDQEKSSEKRDSLINPEGKTLRNASLHRKAIREFPRKWEAFRDI